MKKVVKVAFKREFEVGSIYQAERSFNVGC